MITFASEDLLVFLSRVELAAMVQGLPANGHT